MLAFVKQLQWLLEFYCCEAVKRLLLVEQAAPNTFDLKATDIFIVSK